MKASLKFHRTRKPLICAKVPSASSASPSGPASSSPREPQLALHLDTSFDSMTPSPSSSIGTGPLGSPRPGPCPCPPSLTSFAREAPVHAPLPFLPC
ncbi:hypothetical protein NL676_033779 [Syzygium grande]|nr:hypothetical protein NL676_033779 [Syzygium grande]